MNSSNEFKFYSPELMKEEIIRYSSKLLKASKLKEYHLLESAYRILSTIELISEEIIKSVTWKQAFELTKSIDENDTPFVALTMDIKGFLWTGDKKLINGLKLKGFDDVFSTNELLKIRDLYN